MKILFICKHNRFRSRVAEAYFKKINKNKDIKVDSAGIFQGSYPLDKAHVKVAKEFGINIKGKPKAISEKDMEKTGIYVIVADNVPSSIFESEKYNKRIIRLEVKDVDKNTEEEIRKIIKEIMSKVDKLNEELK